MVRLLTSIAALFVWGFIRDFIFVNINWIVDFNTNPVTRVKESQLFAPWADFDPEVLQLLKWPLTLFFILSYMGIAILALRFCDRKNTKLIVWLTAGFLLTGLITYGIGVITNNTTTFYTITRGLLGIIQSPLPFFIAYVTSNRLNGPTSA